MNTQRWILLLTSAVASVCMALPAAAADWGLDLGTAGIRTSTTGATRLLGSTSHGGSAVRLHREMAPDLLIGLEYWHAATTANWVYGTETSTKSDAAIADLRFRYRAKNWLEPFVRCGIGAAHTQVEVDGGTATLRSEQWAPLALASVGLELLIPRRVFARGVERKEGFTMGLTWEFGYQHLFQSEWEAKLVGGSPSGIAAAPVSFGDAAITGWLTRVAFAVRL